MVTKFTVCSISGSEVDQMSLSKEISERTLGMGESHHTDQLLFVFNYICLCLEW